MMIYSLDTSALLAHFYREEGYHEVHTLLSDPTAEAVICAPVLLELDSSLKRRNLHAQQRRSVLELYGYQLLAVMTLDEEAVMAAVCLREAAIARLPAMDALIAGYAKANSTVLVHRDPHFDAIPANLLKCWRLPGANPFGHVSSETPPMVREKSSAYKTGRKRKSAP